MSAPETPHDNPLVEFKRRVRREVAAGRTLTEAETAAASADPWLYRQYLDASNQAARRHREERQTRQART